MASSSSKRARVVTQDRIYHWQVTGYVAHGLPRLQLGTTVFQHTLEGKQPLNTFAARVAAAREKDYRNLYDNAVFCLKKSKEYIDQFTDKVTELKQHSTTSRMTTPNCGTSPTTTRTRTRR